MGIPEERVGHVSALTSSLYSISGAMSSTLHSVGQDLDMVSLATGPSQTVVIAIKDLAVGNVLLWVTADNVGLGVLLVRAKAAAQGVREALADL